MENQIIIADRMQETFIIKPEFIARMIALNPDYHWLDSGIIKIEPERKGEIKITEDTIIQLIEKCHKFYEDIMTYPLDLENERLYDEMENYLAPSHCNLIASLCFHADLAIRD